MQRDDFDWEQPDVTTSAVSEDTEPTDPSVGGGTAEGSRRRPTGLTVLAVLVIIFGAFVILAGLPLLSAGDVEGVGLTEGASPLAMGLLFVGMGAAELAFGIGALLLKRWAWMLGIVLFSFAILMVTVQMFILGPAPLFFVALGLYVVALVYLLSADVRAAFGRESRHRIPTGTAPSH